MRKTTTKPTRSANRILGLSTEVAELPRSILIKTLISRFMIHILMFSFRWPVRPTERRPGTILAELFPLNSSVISNRSLPFVLYKTAIVVARTNGSAIVGDQQSTSRSDGKSWFPLFVQQTLWRSLWRSKFDHRTDQPLKFLCPKFLVMLVPISSIVLSANWYARLATNFSILKYIQTV